MYHTKISGTIINYGDRKPIAGVKVFIQEGISTSGSLLDDPNSKGEAYVETYTDSLGRFSLEIESELQPILFRVKEGYSPSTTSMGTAILLGNKTYINEVYEMLAEANFDPIIFSKNATVNDSVIFENIYNRYKKNNDNQIIGNDYLSINALRYYYGIGSFRVYFDEYPTTGDMYQPYRITLKRNGTTKEILDSVYIKAFETFKDTLYY